MLGGPHRHAREKTALRRYVREEQRNPPRDGGPASQSTGPILTATVPVITSTKAAKPTVNGKQS
jgi:hypothetical protein